MLASKMTKRFIAGILAFAMAFVLPGGHMSAAEKQKTVYIKDFMLYIDEGNIKSYVSENEDSSKAKKWFEDKGYTMIEGNLNSEASGMLKKNVAVYLGYSTTTERKEAVTDIAVMNERGNYSVGEYEKILKEQKKMYDDMVSDMKTMLEEYRKNVNDGVPTALQSKDFLNGYIDDDTKTKLGDLLMTIDDEKLGTILMQANGQVVLAIEESLSYACDTGKTTWLDRMTKLGSYEALEKKAYKASNNDITKANKLLDKKYKEDALTLANNWEDLKSHFDRVRDFQKKNELDNKSSDEVYKFLSSNANNEEVQDYLDTTRILSTLACNKYEEKTLFEYFDQPVETFKGDGIRKLYPLVASLSEGQISGVDQMMSIFSLISNALGASVFNDLKSGETSKMLGKVDTKEKEEAETQKEEVEKSLEEWQEQNPVSIYEGVDREVFKGGVAVTSTAHEYSNGDGKTWADALVNSKVAKGAAAGVMVGSVAFLTGAIIASRYMHSVYDKLGIKAFDNLIETWEYMDKIPESGIINMNGVSIDTTLSYANQPNKVKNFVLKHSFKEKAAANAGMSADEMYTKYRLINGAKLGLCIAGIALAVADIVTTSITLYKYYNRDHLDIPATMVDMSYNESKQTSFVSYKNVLDNNNKAGDLNGGGGKQWLALYQTHDEAAGEPILAPQNGGNCDIIVRYGKAKELNAEEFSPLHLFGTPNTAQNLTYADGESGWSYKDGKKGTYLLFHRTSGVAAEGKADDKEVKAVSGSAVDIGTSISMGTLALIAILNCFAGFFIGFVISKKR